jgi:DNA replication protein DnaC
MDALPNPDRVASARLLHDAEQERVAQELAQKNRPVGAVPISLKIALDDRSAACPEHGSYISHGYAFGATRKREFWSPCPKCKEIAEDAEKAEAEQRERRHHAERRDAEAQAAGIPRRFRACTFENFVADTEAKQAVFTACSTYARQLALGELRQGRGLVLAGPPGNGKTHVGAAILRYLLDTGWRRVRYTSCADLVGAVRATWARNSPKTEEQVIEELGERLDLLVVDELGVQAGTENEQAILFRILDRRYAEERSTVLLTNLNTTRLKEFVGDRLYDRLRETHQWVTFAWESYRATAGQEDS